MARYVPHPFLLRPRVLLWVAVAAVGVACATRERDPAQTVDLAELLARDDPLLRGDVAAREGRIDDAVAAYDAAVTRDPGAVRAHLRLVAALSDAGARSVARERYRAAAARSGASEVERVMAARLSTDGSPPAVRAVYVEAAKASPDNPWWRLALAEIDLASAQSWLAVQEQAREEGDRPAAARALEVAGRALARAQSAVENAAARGPHLPEVPLYRGLLRSLEADLLLNASARAAAERAAADAFEQATVADPTSVEAWANLADARRRLGESAEALSAYRAALRLAAGDAELRLGAGAVLHDLGRHDDAVEQLKEAARLAPQDPTPLIAEGDAWAAAGKPHEALGAWARALARTGSAVEAHERRGAVLESLGQDGEARAEYAAYLARGGPDEARVKRRMARLIASERPR